MSLLILHKRTNTIPILRKQIISGTPNNNNTNSALRTDQVRTKKILQSLEVKKRTFSIILLTRSIKNICLFEGPYKSKQQRDANELAHILYTKTWNSYVGKFNFWIQWISLINLDIKLCLLIVYMRNVGMSTRIVKIKNFSTDLFHSRIDIF